MRKIDSKSHDTKDQKISNEEYRSFTAFDDIQDDHGLLQVLMEAMKTPIDASVLPSAFLNHYVNPPEVSLYLVGGAVREIVRGFPEKINDWDFAVEAPSFESMRVWIMKQGFEIFVETPEYFTIRARASKDFSFAGMDMSGKTFDFVLARSESEYTDGRRPDTVSPGTLEQDLARRDFTMNAMAMDTDGQIIDPFGGKKDIEDKLIRCVGGVDRFDEDFLRVLRAIRFTVQLGFAPDRDAHQYMASSGHHLMMKSISEDRVRDELTKCFKNNPLKTLEELSEYEHITGAIFEAFPNLWLLPTSKGK